MARVGLSHIATGLCLTSMTLSPSALAQSQTREVRSQEILGEAAVGLPLDDLRDDAKTISSGQRLNPLLGRPLQVRPRDILLADINKPRGPALVIPGTGVETAAARLAKKLADQSMVIGESQGLQAVNLLAPEPGEILGFVGAKVTTASNRCGQIAQVIAEHPQLATRIQKGHEAARLTPQELGWAREFAEACFRSPFENSADPFLASLAARAAVLEMDLAKGDPSQIANRSYCSALLIDGNRVATARHCLFPAGRRIGNEVLNVLPLGPQLAALTRIPAEIDPIYELPGKSIRWDPNVAEDFVILRLARPVPLPVAPLGLASQGDLESAQEFYQAGYQHVVSLVHQKYPITITDFRAAYRLDASKYCVAIRFTTACLVQGCQSIQRTSGAAFLVRNGATVKLAATLYGGATGVPSETAACFDQAIGDNITINISSRAR